ncbi:MAG: DUF2752 domain-containing protein [Maribacter sp.]|nr:DUF2752 domain-containing protein [Maribacter sp.]
MRMVTSLFLAEDFMLPCLNKKLFGIECPGCGAQRSVSLLFQGEFVEAFQMYPAIYTIIPLLGFLLADNFFSIRYANRIIIALMILSVILMLGNYILKIL